MMKLYKVKSLTSLNIEIKHLFRKNETYDCWYTTKCKFIYANNDAEAISKYREMFFTPLAKNEWCKYLLELHRWCADDKSDNMKFNLPFNYFIKHVEEQIMICNEPITENINFIRNNMCGEDFKNWWHDYYTESDDPDWDCK